MVLENARHTIPSSHARILVQMPSSELAERWLHPFPEYSCIRKHCGRAALKLPRFDEDTDGHKYGETNPGAQFALAYVTIAKLRPVHFIAGSHEQNDPSDKKAEPSGHPLLLR